MEISELYKLFILSNGVTTDSRNIKKNQLFFALKGDNFNGNTYAEKALELGASYSIIDEISFKINEKCIVVNDVLSTLQELANYHLHQINPKHILAITGSNGKTTTKELVNAVLATKYKTHYTKGNLNNHIGIPLTILEMEKETEIAIIEMGANHQQEIKSYCNYVEPTCGIITNIGKAHLEGFGGIDGVKKGKGELYDYLKIKNATIFYNNDNPILQKMLDDREIINNISYGKSTASTYSILIKNDFPILKISFKNVEITSNLYGDYNFDNIACAIAVASYFDVELQDIKNAIENYYPTNKRSEIIQKSNHTIVADYYNANPTSMQHALESLAKSSSKNKIVILGDMFELGEYATIEHQRIADLCLQLNFDAIVLVGDAFQKTNVQSDKILKFNSSADAATWYKKQLFSDTSILLKGSRGMKMEKVIE